jgi:hypothetical protein
MKNVWITIFLSVLMLGIAAAQDNATSSPQPPQAQSSQRAASSASAGAPERMAAGTVIPVELTKTVDAKKAKTGDEVIAKVTQDMKSTTGEVVVAKDTKVLGHVTEAQARSKEQKESEVAIAFDRAVMKNGSEMQMPMSIQAIIGPQNNGPQNNQNSGGGGGSYGSVPQPGASSNPNAARGGGMGGSAPSPTPSPMSGNIPSDAQSGTSSRPPITAQTEGVIGISDLKLTPTAPAANQGSVVSSEKNNVKLESGTLMLLRVNQ